MARKSKRVRVGTGERCPSCNAQMDRYRHPDGVVLVEGQFQQWDVCSCGRIQHYEAFRYRAGRELGQPEIATPKKPPRDPAGVARKIAEHTGNVHLGSGGPCRKCHGPTERFAHPPGWRPPAGQQTYAQYWDRCLACEIITWRPEASVSVDEEFADAIAREQATALEHFRSI